MLPEILEEETVLPDDYPVYRGYFYLADGKVIESPATGKVEDLKRHLRCQEVRRCNMEARGLS